MRGTPRIGVESAASPGIIPAYAGNTGVIDLTGQRFEDHPRVCGEHSHELEHVVALQGSSPRMRGTPVLLCVCSFVGSSPRMRGTRSINNAAQHFNGIIPAYAGNTHASVTGERAKRDHPRVCGEHACGRAHVQFVQGSSPRMRGTRVRAGLIPLGFGIIPAYAGNTPAETTSDCYNWDHPRVCGEHIKSFAMFAVR